MKISYLVGLPFGLISILLVFWMSTLFIGDSLFSVIINGIYGKAAIGLLVSFLLALGVAGYLATKSIQKQKSLLETSFRYSLNVNTIIWSVFLIINFMNSENYLIQISVSLLGFVFCTLSTTFTIGLLISLIIQNKIRKSNSVFNPKSLKN